MKKKNKRQCVIREGLSKKCLSWDVKAEQGTYMGVFREESLAGERKACVKMLRPRDFGLSENRNMSQYDLGLKGKNAEIRYCGNL